MEISVDDKLLPQRGDRMGRGPAKVDLSCRQFSTSVAISAAHTLTLNASRLVPTNVLILKLCFSALKTVPPAAGPRR